MDVILSIKPKYVEQIINGKKKYEFRRKIFKEQHIGHIIVYSSSPVKKVVGYFTIQEIYSEHPKNLWSNYRKYSGISKKEFLRYFKNSKNGYAIEINQFILFKNPVELSDIGINNGPPQSYMYIKDNKSVYENYF